MESEAERRIETQQFNVREGNISLVLDSYDDLFSDFDPRHYSERMLSDDFLSEVKRATRDKEGVVELRLLVPMAKRKAHEEFLIKRRLKEYFRKHLKEEEKTISKIKREGLSWFFIGSFILVLSTFLYEYKLEVSSYWGFLMDFLFIITQPAGWFTLWEGLGKIFIVSREESPNYNFYKKLSEANIYFLNY